MISLITILAVAGIWLKKIDLFAEALFLNKFLVQRVKAYLLGNGIFSLWWLVVRI